jgi:hypothetical protein
MATPIHEPTPGTREHFLQITTMQRWGTIQDYVDLCRVHGYFTPAFYATAIAHMERIHVRRRLKQVRDARGWPVFGNIERVGPDGTLERVFLQEELFGPEEYRQIVAYHYGMARRHLRSVCSPPRRRGLFARQELRPHQKTSFHSDANGQVFRGRSATHVLHQRILCQLPQRGAAHATEIDAIVAGLGYRVNDQGRCQEIKLTYTPRFATVAPSRQER